MFTSLGRDPSVVECFDLAQSNSEHSRHWFFRGDLVIDGQLQPDSLFDMIMDTQKGPTNQNNVIKFSDNSSAIDGFDVKKFLPDNLGKPGVFGTKAGKRHLVFTAETHNFPTAISPFR
jgi:phosphoribosylformylglycinamidine synthase